jgi:hypothetical protein
LVQSRWSLFRNAIHSLRHYYSAAVAHSHVPVLDAIATVEKFLENEPSAVQLHPHFPAKLSNSKNHCARVLAEKGQKSGGLAAISAKFKDEPGHPDVAAAINASVEESEAYPERLKHFVRDFQDDILPHQIPFINSLIRKHEAKVGSLSLPLSSSSSARVLPMVMATYRLRTTPRRTTAVDVPRSRWLRRRRSTSSRPRRRR